MEEVYGTKLEYEQLGSLEELGKQLTAARAAHPNEPFMWLGLAYNYFTINGQTLMRGSDNERFRNFRPESLRTLCSKHSLQDLPHLYTATAKLTADP